MTRKLSKFPAGEYLSQVEKVYRRHGKLFIRMKIFSAKGRLLGRITNKVA